MTRRANQLSGADWLKNSFSIWRGLARDKDASFHPAPFPVDLANKVIESYASDPDGVVLDPFAGSGSTLLAALQCGMEAVGFDINPAYREQFLHRLTLFDIGNSGWHYETGDARSMCELIGPASVELCFTSPPYWDVMNRKRSVDRKDERPYSKDVNDLGNLEDYDDFLSALTEVANQVKTVLRDGGYFVLNVMDLRKGPTFYPLHIDAACAIQGQQGFTLEDIIIWDRQSDYNSMRPLGYPYKFIINKVHEYLLIFRRQNGRVRTALDGRATGGSLGVSMPSRNGNHH